MKGRLLRGTKDGMGIAALFETLTHSRAKKAAMAFLAMMAAAPGAALAGVQFKSFQTHSHVMFSVDPSVTYSVEKIQQNGKDVGLRLILDGVREELDGLVQVFDQRTERVKMSRQGEKAVYEFYFNGKTQTAGIEYFDYRNKVPSEVALDYWPKSAKPDLKPAKAPKKAAMPKVAASKKQVFSFKDEKNTKNAHNALGGCGDPLKLQEDGFAFWKVVHRKFDYRNYFKLVLADDRYSYPFLEIGKKENLGKRAKEIAHYRLAHKMAREGKLALALRTIEFFETQYPQSMLQAELEFLKASTLVQLSRLLKTDRYLDQAFEMYRNIYLKAPDAERGQFSLAFLVQELVESDNPGAALEYALMGVDKAGKNLQDPKAKESIDAVLIYRLAVAEILFAIGEYDRAERSYQNLMEQANPLSVEAAYRIGEVFMGRKFYERAIIAFEKAIKQFPKDALRFPSTWFNLAESYFRIERFAESEKVYKDFFAKFPADDLAWASEMRQVELEQLKLKKPEPSMHFAVRDRYEAIINRYPYSPAAMMAQLRLAKCLEGTATDREKNFFYHFFAKREPKTYEHEIVDAIEVERWMDLTELQFLVNSGRYRDAMKRADDYRLKLGKIPFSDQFRAAFSKAFVGLVSSAINGDESQLVDLLVTLEHYGDYAPKTVPFAYDMAVAKARFLKGDLGATKTSLQSLEKRMGEATDGEKDEYYLIHARLSRLLGEKPETITVTLNKITDQGRLGKEKQLELERAAIDRKAYKEALAHEAALSKNPLLSRLTAKERFEVQLRQIDNLAASADPAEVSKAIERALLLVGTLTEFPEYIMRLNDLRAEYLFRSGKFKEASEAIADTLDRQPNHPRRSEFEFMKGKSLAAMGREKEAAESFRRVAQTQDEDVWKKSAQEELNHLEWESKIQKNEDKRN